MKSTKTTDKNEGFSKDGKYKDFFKKGDIVIALIVVVLVVLTLVFAFGKDATEAEIYIDGQLKYRLNLSEDTTLELLDGKMIVKVSGGKISVAQSNCAEQLCVHSSAIDKDGGMIVCLPNKVVIKVVAREVDAIT